MSNLTPSDAKYIIDCVKHIRDWDEYEPRSSEATAIQNRFEQFVRGITLSGEGHADS